MNEETTPCYQTASNPIQIRSTCVTGVVFQEKQMCFVSKDDRSPPSILVPSHIKHCSEYKNITPVSKTGMTHCIWLSLSSMWTSFIQHVNECLSKFCVFTALTVRYLTRRFIGEYRSNTGKNTLQFVISEGTFKVLQNMCLIIPYAT